MRKSQLSARQPIAGKRRHDTPFEAAICWSRPETGISHGFEVHRQTLKY